MDVIFCRNVLMYFVRSHAKAVIAKFRRSLVEGGWLIVAPTDGSYDLFSEFTSVRPRTGVKGPSLPTS